ncbi:MAG: efflux RND transporter periplasmic adaptor subunit [Bacteroidales bacterium]
MKSPYKSLLFAGMHLILFSCGPGNMENNNEIATPVSVTELTPAPISRFINTSGTALATKEATLKSGMSGKYQLQTNPATGKPFRLGDKVQEGQVIIRFEDKEFENTQAVESRQLNLTISEQEQMKQKALYEKGGVTLSEMRNTEVKVNDARLAYENALLKMENMKVIAPFNGVIVDLPHYTQNTRVETGAPMVTLMDYATLYMEVNLPENTLRFIRPEQGAHITHYTLPADTVQGKIRELSPAINKETRTYKGKLVIDNQHLKIRPGMFVRADILVENNNESVVIPKRVILSQGNDKKYVFVLDRNQASRRDITTGIEQDDKVEVTEGLKIGDQVITRGFETLRDRSAVKVEK